MSDEPVMVCTQCGQRCIKRHSGMVILTLPAFYEAYWWCGNCGRRGESFTERHPTADELAMAEWRKANGMEANA